MFDADDVDGVREDRLGAVVVCMELAVTVRVRRDVT